MSINIYINVFSKILKNNLATIKFLCCIVNKCFVYAYLAEWLADTRKVRNFIIITNMVNLDRSSQDVTKVGTVISCFRQRTGWKVGDKMTKSSTSKIFTKFHYILWQTTIVLNVCVLMLHWRSVVEKAKTTSGYSTVYCCWVRQLTKPVRLNTLHLLIKSFAVIRSLKTIVRDLIES